MDDNLNEQLPLSTVHDALDIAMEEFPQADTEEVGVSFRTHPRKKALIHLICAQRGVTPSQFYRSCGEVLLKDFLSPQEYEKLNQECGGSFRRYTFKATS